MKLGIAGLDETPRIQAAHVGVAGEVKGQTQAADPLHDELVFLAGHAYRDPLAAWCEAEGFTVSTPLCHLGIGQQLSWFDKQLSMINDQ